MCYFQPTQSHNQAKADCGNNKNNNNEESHMNGEYATHFV